MPARLILQIDVRHAVGSQRRVEQHAVTTVHDGVVLAVHEEHGGTAVRHVSLQRERVEQLLIVHPALSQQPSAGTLVDAGVQHRHHRVYGGNEGGPVAPVEHFCRRHHQMASRRKAHHPYPAAVDTVFIRMGPHMAQGFQQVVLGVRIAGAAQHVAIAGDKGGHIGRAIVQHKGSNTLLLQPTGHHVPLSLCGVPEVAAAGTDDHCRMAAAFHRVGRQLLPGGSGQ